MAANITVTRDKDVRVPLQWIDSFGNEWLAPMVGTSATSSNHSVVSAVEVASNGASLMLRIAGVGTSTITVANGRYGDTFEVTVVDPSITLIANTAGIEYVAHGTEAG